MSQKLEDRLHLYERDHPIRDDQELISALNAILEEQDELPVEDRDFDLISEATDAVLHLSGYSDEQLADMADKSVERIFSRFSDNNSSCKKKTNISHPRIAWIIIAIIVLTITSTAISASVLGINIPSMTKKFILSLAEKIVYKDDNTEVIRTDDVITLSSIYDLKEKYNNYNLFLPNLLDSSISHSEITVIDFEEKLVFNISLVFSDDQKATIRITHDPFSNFDTSTDNSGLTSVKLTNYDDLYQGEFADNYNGNYYIIQATSSTLVNTIINSLEDSYENHP